MKKKCVLFHSHKAYGVNSAWIYRYEAFYFSMLPKDVSEIYILFSSHSTKLASKEIGDTFNWKNNPVLMIKKNESTFITFFTYI